MARTPDRRGFRISAPVAFNPTDFLAFLNGERLPLKSSLIFMLMGDNDLLRSQLRLYVNEWLSTGMTGHGECPRERDLTKAPNASRAIRRFSDRGAVDLVIERGGVSAGFVAYPPMTLQNMARVAQAQELAEESADRLFTILFMSGWHRRLGRCTRLGECGRYFELKHWNRLYKRGTVCPECTRVRSLESAALNTSRTREQVRNDLYRLVAARFANRISRRADWHRDLKLRATVLEFLNQRIGKDRGLKAIYGDGITGKWLSWSRNRKGIEEAVKRSVYAQGKRA